MDPERGIAWANIKTVTSIALLHTLKVTIETYVSVPVITDITGARPPFLALADLAAS